MVSPWKVGVPVDERLDLEVGDARPADVGHAHAEHQRVHEIAHHHVLPVHGLVLGEPGVDVQGMVVHGDHAEQVVVGLGDRLARPVAVDVAGDEVLEVAAERALVGGHGWRSPRIRGVVRCRHDGSGLDGRARVVNPSEAPGSASPSMVSRQTYRVPGPAGSGPG